MTLSDKDGNLVARHANDEVFMAYTPGLAGPVIRYTLSNGQRVEVGLSEVVRLVTAMVEELDLSKTPNYRAAQYAALFNAVNVESVRTCHAAHPTAKQQRPLIVT